jgi:hypothetical protein
MPALRRGQARPCRLRVCDYRTGLRVPLTSAGEQFLWRSQPQCRNFRV